jgi:homocitrate synthase NifV
VRAPAGTISGDEPGDGRAGLPVPIPPRTALSVWSPCRVEDVRRAALLGVDRVSVGVPSSDAHMGARLGMGRSELLARMAVVVRAAREAGFGYVSVGLEDCSRADAGFLVRMAMAAEDAGASRVRLADTVGLLTPVRMAELVRLVRSRVSLDVAVHCHNDLGMATANAVTALEAGAAYADVSVLGLGERAGIARLEEVMARQVLARTGSGADGGGLAGRTCAAGYRMDAAVALCRSLSAALGRPMPVDKPVTGGRIFACETGIHAHGVLRDPALFEPFSPELTGQRRTVAVGKKSGRAAVLHATGRLGVEVGPARAGALVAAVRAESARLGRPLRDEELLALCTGAGKEGAPCTG